MSIQKRGMRGETFYDLMLRSRHEKFMPDPDVSKKEEEEQLTRDEKNEDSENRERTIPIDYHDPQATSPAKMDEDHFFMEDNILSYPVVKKSVVEDDPEIRSETPEDTSGAAGVIHIIDYYKSDSSAVYHHVSHLIRTILGSQDHFVLRSSSENTNTSSSCTEKTNGGGVAHVIKDGTAAVTVSDTSAQPLGFPDDKTSGIPVEDGTVETISDEASHEKTELEVPDDKTVVTAEKDEADHESSDDIMMGIMRSQMVVGNFLDERETDTQIAVFDGLLAFDIRHFSSTLPSHHLLDTIRILIEPDAFTLMVSIFKFFKEDIVFCSDLKLMVIYMGRDHIKDLLKFLNQVTVSEEISFEIIIVTPAIPKKIPKRYQKIRLETDSMGHIKSTIFPSDVDMDTQISGYEIIGSSSLNPPLPTS